MQGTKRQLSAAGALAMQTHTHIQNPKDKKQTHAYNNHKLMY